MRPSRPARLLLRFTASALIAFVAIGAVMSIVLSRQINRRGEATARFHAAFVTNSILSYELTNKDLRAPLHPSGKRYRELLAFVQARVLHNPVVRVKIWASDGTVLFSDVPALVGQRFAPEDDLKEAFDGKIESGVSDLSSPENRYERTLAPKLFETYTPLRLAGSSPGDRPAAVAELYQAYAGIAQQTSQLRRTVLFTMAGGLAVLYVLLLPIFIPLARKLSDQNRRLEHEVRRSEELFHKEHATVAELRKLNRLQGEFVAIASHELRTPLTSIIGYAKTLRQPQFANDAAARDEFLHAIERQGDRLFQLVENLLTSAHLEDHILRLSITTFPFPDLARDVVEGLGSKGVRVKLQLPADLPALLSDRQYVAQILSNLLGNALKFSPNNAPVLVGAKWERGVISFWVQDRGIGIPEDAVGRIFDRFYQVDSSSTRPYGGIGLGLSLVKDLVQTLGGAITVASRPNEGSTFTVTLPLVHPSVGETYGHSGSLTAAESGESRQPARAGAPSA